MLRIKGLFILRIIKRKLKNIVQQKALMFFGPEKYILLIYLIRKDSQVLIRVDIGGHPPIPLRPLFGFICFRDYSNIYYF